MTVFLCITALLVSHGAYSTEIHNRCPECCSCSVNQNEAHVSCTCVPEIIPNDTISFELQSDENHFEPWLNFTHPSWQTVSSFSWFGGADVATIPKSTFHGLSNLRTLRISNYFRLEYIPTGTFKHLKSLKVLNLSNNWSLRLERLSSLIPDLQRMSVEVFNITRTNRFDYGSLLTLLAEDFLLELKSGNMSLKTIDISWTRGVMFDFHDIESNNLPRFPNLESLNMSNLNLQIIRPPTHFSVDIFHSVFPVLKQLIINNVKYPNAVPYSPQTCTRRAELVQPHIICSNPNEQKVSLPPSLEDLEIGNLKLLPNKCFELRHRVCCFDENNRLRSISLKGWEVTGWNTVVFGLKHLISLDLGNNRIGFILDASFNHLPKLQRLLLGSNHLWMFQHDPMFENSLSNCSNLREVDLSANRLSWIPKMLFDSNGLLQTIDLSDNRLNSITFKIDQLLHLKILNLSKNILSVISGPTQRGINKIFTGYSFPFMDLIDNNFTCECDTNTFIKTLHDISHTLINYENYTCLYEQSVVKLDTIDDTTLYSDCVVEILKLALPSVCLVLLVLFLILLVYRKKVYIIKLYVICRFWRYRKKQARLEDRVFLAYSHFDKDLVLSRIYPELNLKLQQLLHTENDVVYINDKDFALPGLIDEEIVMAVSSCKCTIALISKHFLQSSWTHLELSYSWIKKRPIILVLLEEIQKKQLRGILRYCYSRNVRLVWPKDENDQQLFWTNLLRGIVRTLKPSRTYRFH